MIISILGRCLPKLWEPTYTSERLIIRYKKTFKLLEIYKAIIFQPGLKKKKHHLNYYRFTFFCQRFTLQMLTLQIGCFFHIILPKLIKNKLYLRKQHFCFSSKLTGEENGSTCVLKYSSFSRLDSPASSLPRAALSPSWFYTSSHALFLLFPPIQSRPDLKERSGHWM